MTDFVSLVSKQHISCLKEQHFHKKKNINETSITKMPDCLFGFKPVLGFWDWTRVEMIYPNNHTLTSLNAFHYQIKRTYKLISRKWTDNVHNVRHGNKITKDQKKTKTAYKIQLNKKNEKLSYKNPRPPLNNQQKKPTTPKTGVDHREG